MRKNRIVVLIKRPQRSRFEIEVAGMRIGKLPETSKILHGRTGRHKKRSIERGRIRITVIPLGDRHRLAQNTARHDRANCSAPCGNGRLRRGKCRKLPRFAPDERGMRPIQMSINIIKGIAGVQRGNKIILIAERNFQSEAFFDIGKEFLPTLR